MNHPAGQIVYLTDGNVKVTLPDGKTQEEHGKAGETSWGAVEKHLPENLSEKRFEAILVEMRTTPAKRQSVKDK